MPPLVQGEFDIFLDKAQVALVNSIQNGDIFYTLDGREPDENALQYDGPLSIRTTTTVTARTRWPDGSWSQSNSREFTKVTKLAALAVTDLKAGLTCQYFEKSGERWEKLPDFASLTPASSGIVEGIDLSFAERPEMYGLIFNGYLLVPMDGVYSFYTNSDDGSKLYIDGQEVVDNDFNHSMIEKRGDIALQAGYHRITVTFFQGVGGQGLEVAMRGQDMKKQKIDPEMLFH